MFVGLWTSAFRFLALFVCGFDLTSELDRVLSQFVSFGMRVFIGFPLYAYVRWLMTVRDIEGKVFAVESGEVFLFVLFFFLFLDGNYLAIYVLHVRTDRVRLGLFSCFFGLGVLLRCIFAAVCCDVVSYPIYRIESS